jgi:CBS domain-containing protein
VVDASFRVLGVVTESDLLAGGEGEGGSVGDAMTSPAVTVTAVTTVDQARTLLAARDIGRLPVVDGRGHLIGVVGRGDLPAGPQPGDEELRRRITDRVIGIGGDVYSVSMAHGSVVVRGRVADRGEIPVVERLLRRTAGVTGVRLDFDYDDPPLRSR